MFDIDNIEMILSITIAYFAGSFILTIFFYNLYFLQKHSSLLKWVFAWLLLSLAYLSLFFAINYSVDILYGLYSLLLISYAYLFWYASSSFLKFSLAKYNRFIMLFLYTSIIILTIITQYVAWTIFIAFMTISFFFFIIGYRFTKEKDLFYNITGYIIILFSIASFFYPFLAFQSWFMPWGYIVFGMLGLFIGMSLIQVHFQAQKKELTSMKNKLYYLAHHDTLTDVYNRLFMDNEFKRIENEQIINVGILFIDLNNFKQINDTYGHQRGDQVLKIFTDKLSIIIKDNGYIMRYGGDEFIILLYNSTLEEINIYQDKIIDHFKKHLINGTGLKFAIGGSFRNVNDKDMYALLDKAESKMYENKSKQKELD